MALLRPSRGEADREEEADAPAQLEASMFRHGDAEARRFLADLFRGSDPKYPFTKPFFAELTMSALDALPRIGEGPLFLLNLNRVLATKWLLLSLFRMADVRAGLCDLVGKLLHKACHGQLLDASNAYSLGLASAALGSERMTDGLLTAMALLLHRRVGEGLIMRKELLTDEPLGVDLIQLMSCIHEIVGNACGGVPAWVRGAGYDWFTTLMAECWGSTNGFKEVPIGALGAVERADVVRGVLFFQPKCLETADSFVGTYFHQVSAFHKALATLLSNVLYMRVAEQGHAVSATADALHAAADHLERDQFDAFFSCLRKPKREMPIAQETAEFANASVQFRNKFGEQFMSPPLAEVEVPSESAPGMDWSKALEAKLQTSALGEHFQLALAKGLTWMQAVNFELKLPLTELAVFDRPRWEVDVLKKEEADKKKRAAEAAPVSE